MRELVIKPKSVFRLDVQEIWEYRELFYFLAWRDLKVRYKQTAIGVAWAVLQPLLTTVVFTVFFGKIAGITTGNIPYPVFAFTGLLFWNYFSNFLSDASGSLVANRGIIEKVYFPRLIVPLSGIVVYLVDFFIGLIMFGVLVIVYGVHVSLLGIAFIIPAVCIATLASSGLGMFFAALNVKYRDVRYALPFFIQLIMFVSPVIYPASVLGRHQWLWYFNPLSGVLEGTRSLLFGLSPLNVPLLLSSAGMSIVLFVVGLLYFKRTEQWFADIV